LRFFRYKAVSAHVPETLAREESVASIASFVKQHRRKGITEALNEVYAADAEQSKLDPVLQKLQARSLNREDW